MSLLKRKPPPTAWLASHTEQEHRGTASKAVCHPATPVEHEHEHYIHILHKLLLLLFSMVAFLSDLSCVENGHHSLYKQVTQQTYMKPHFHNKPPDLKRPFDS